jgi:transposase
LTTKVHLAADLRCRPISTTLTAGHRHDCTAFDTVMAGIRIHRSGPGRLKQFRAVATRYDKRRHKFQATVGIATMKIWLPDLTKDPRDRP